MHHLNRFMRWRLTQFRAIDPATGMNIHGWTLIELMVAVALGMLLLTLATPTFERTLREHRLTTLSNDLLAMLNLARSEAVRRGTTVVICKSADGQNCGGTDWSVGWIIFANADNRWPPTVDPGDEILRYWPALLPGYTLSASSNFTNYIAYRASGRSNTMGRFVLCKDGQLAQNSRAVFVSITGRARVGLDENHNGIPDSRDADQQIVDIPSCQA